MKAFGPFKILTFALITSFFAEFAVNAAQNAANDINVKPGIEILAFGDSLTAGYGLPAGDGFTDQLEVWINKKLDRQVKVINGGVSGDTTSGARSRLDWALSPIKNGKPDLVVLTLGGNDVLRGITPDLTRENMDAMLKLLTERNIPVLIGGMRSTPSWGPEFVKAFDSIYTDLAAKYGVPLYPFFLDGVDKDLSLRQADGLHPTKEGVTIIVDKIGPVVLGLLPE